MIDVVVVVYNPKEVAIECVKRMRQFDKAMNRLILVDNFSKSDEIVKQLRPYVDEYIRPKQQISLAAAWNLGILHAETQNVIISNDDIYVTEDWLVPIDRTLQRQSSKDIGVLQPYNTLSGLPANFPNNYVKEPRVGNIPRDNFVGCCFAINRTIYDKLKEFDKTAWPDDWKDYSFFYEPLYPFGAEDQDFYERVRRAGFKTLTHFGSYIHHFTGATMSQIPDFEQIKERGNQTFRERWQNAKA